mmetsp:Transcript_40480/g.127434  ORF Transcript_40480/g.127434 Transcript_40480/m.127434 type:complete len:191 (+) Transcript_40480:62-634(+)
MMSPAMLRILVAVLASCTVASEPLDRVEAVGEAECEAASLNLIQSSDMTGTRDFAEAVATQLQYELNMSTETTGEKNKIILVVLELLGLGLCGIDRCYMGQTCVGVIKGLTLGGMIVWAFLDYIGVIVTCLSRYPSINYLGMRANFDPSSVTAAFVIVIVAIVLKCCCCCLGVRRFTAPREIPESEAGAK